MSGIMRAGYARSFLPSLHVSRDVRCTWRASLARVGLQTSQRPVACSVPSYGTHGTHWRPADANQRKLVQNSEDEEEELSQPELKAFERAKASATASLALRSQSRQQLFEKLTDRGYDSHIVHKALDRLQEVGLQSDHEFAETFARSRWRQNRWAASRIRIELTKKGIAKEDAERAITGVFGDDHAVRLHNDTIGEHDLEGPERELMGSARRQSHLTRGLPIETRRRRMVSWLQRRGHGWATISDILQRLDM